MRFGGFGFDRQFGFSAPAIASAAAPSEPVEMFPDTDLTAVADETDGWSFSDGAPFFGPTGGTGPGISIDAEFSGSTALLVGAANTAFNAAVPALSTRTVALTIGNFISGSVKVWMKGGEQVVFAPVGNGVLSHTVIAGSGSDFNIELVSEDNDFDITHISVT